MGKVDLSSLSAALGTSVKNVEPVGGRGQSRGDEYRELGNQRMKEGRHEEAIDYYSRAVTVNPQDVAALCNRSGAYAQMRKYVDALRDAEAAAAADKNYARAHSRKGLALFRLGRYGDAAESYETALACGTHPNEEELRKNISDARNAVAKSVSLPDEPTRSPAVRPRRAAGTEHVTHVKISEGERRRRAKREYELQLQKTRAERLLSVRNWQKSTGSEADPTDPTNGLHVFDIFGRLRGKCLSDSSCPGWSRDLGSMKHWGDKTMLICERCGYSNEEHEDCGAALVDPEPPDAPQQKISGVHAA